MLCIAMTVSSWLVLLIWLCRACANVVWLFATLLSLMLARPAFWHSDSNTVLIAMLFWQQYYSYSNSDNLKNIKMHENAICGKLATPIFYELLTVFSFWCSDNNFARILTGHSGTVMPTLNARGWFYIAVNSSKWSVRIIIDSFDCDLYFLLCTSL